LASHSKARRLRVARFVFLALLTCSLTLVSRGPAHAQTWPSKTIKLVLPFGAGGPTDVVARLATQILQDGLGQPAIVENRPGAGGATGTRLVAQAEPDGYTLLMGSVATLAAVPAVQKNAGFDPVKSFAPITELTVSGTLMIVPASLPVNSVAEFIAYAKANPGKLNFASAGYGNQTHLNVELFKMKTGIDIIHVPFKSGGEMLTALLTDQVQLTFSDVSVVLPLVQAKKVKALAVASQERSPLLPDLPTIIESGVPDFVTSFWTGVLAPAGTPPAIVNRLNEVLTQGLKSPKVVSTLTQLGSVPSPSTPQEFAAFIESEVAKWSALVTQAGIKLD
jgi:tripartite-type tricarboxylate transporter receptor subunit TctC